MVNLGGLNLGIKLQAMKLVTYLKDEQDFLGVLVGDRVYDMESLHPDLPNTILGRQFSGSRWRRCVDTRRKDSCRKGNTVTGSAIVSTRAFAAILP